ncbi:hypothetical protein [Streptomyces doebereineriae]|uniref:Uncharacterized protein n=1 Tax=Streptomyces doebereineriae TaxID=3075528 RepID=A0ABU2V620_9ACTN|nr:hypothetical protein [Streptomyces sp. DSM 41640]MDT0480402.1 hypothetical protein [Streptomyces sp. DSM 41640]
MTEADQNQNEGPIAEYTALRSEITTRISLQHQVIALHLTAVSVVFSVALSGSDRWSILLVIPFISYASSEILASLFRTIEGIAKYIEEVLSPRVTGGLGWESWLAQNRPNNEAQRITHPYYLLFSGTSAVSLIATVVFILASADSTRQLNASFWAAVAAWPLAAGVTVLSFRAIRQLRAPF